jgi:hypothetical protein
MEKESKYPNLKERAELFEKYHSDPDQYHKIFTELGFAYTDDNCDGYCPECEIRSKCEVYAEDKDKWDKLDG